MKAIIDSITVRLIYKINPFVAVGISKMRIKNLIFKPYDFTLGFKRSYLMVFSFLQRKCHPLTRYIKKIADLHCCYNIIFYLRRTEHQISKGYAYVYHLIRSIARSIPFRFHILSVCFYNHKKKISLTVF